jgi:hypothetical protein
MDKIFRKAKCCVCEQPMKKSKNVNIVALGLKPTWEYPSMGNVLTNEPNQACAVVCDSCIEKYYDEGFNDKIKFAVELQGEKVLYHAVSLLEPISPVDFSLDFFDDEGDGLSLCPNCGDVEIHGGGLCHGCKQQKMIDKYY